MAADRARDVPSFQSLKYYYCAVKQEEKGINSGHLQINILLPSLLSSLEVIPISEGGKIDSEKWQRCIASKPVLDSALYEIATGNYTCKHLLHPPHRRGFILLCFIRIDNIHHTITKQHILITYCVRGEVACVWDSS